MAENRELALVLKLVADEFQRELKNSQGALAGFGDFLKDWRTQVVAAGTALFALAKQTANFGEEMLKGAQKAGTTVENYSALSHAARMLDLDNQQLITGLKTLSVQMVEAARGNKDAVELFARMGVSVVDATGKLRSIDGVLLDLADVFKNSADGAGKNEAAVKLFAKAWEDFLPFLNNGKGVIRELQTEAQRLSVTLSKEDAEAANKFNDELKRLEAQMRGLSLSAGKPLVGVLTELAELFRSLTANSAAQTFFTALSAQAVMFNTLIKEVAANVEFLFGKMSFDKLKSEIARIEAEAHKKLFLLEHPKADALLNPQKKAAEDTRPQLALGGGADGKKGKQEDPGEEQARRGQQIVKVFSELWKSNNNAIEIQKRLIGEEIDLIFRREQIESDETKAREEGQARLGQQIVEETQRQVREREAAFAQERAALVENLQAWIAYDEQVGASTELRYQHQADLLRASLAQQLQLTTQETGALLIAWQNYDQQLADQILNRTALTAQQRETLEIQSLTKLSQIHAKASDDVFSGWAAGMRRYLRDTESGFGLAADMARRTAQTMEQGFRTFFLDVMNGQVKSLKDVFLGLLDFVKQIIAQITAQMLASQILKFAAGAIGGGLGGGGFGSGAAANQWFGGFATGGSFTVPGFGGTDSQMVGFRATPGERVTIETPEQQQRRGGGGSTINITINTSGGGTRESAGGAAPNLTQLARDIGKMIEAKLVDEKRPGGLLAPA